jgi:hypothetical protein
MELPAVVLSLLLAVPPGAAPATKAADPWSALRFLVGAWKAESGQGKPGVASVAASTSPSTSTGRWLSAAAARSSPLAPAR